jgi:hypothetical protein
MDIDADVRSLANTAMANPGSFYTSSEVGTLLLIPGAAKIVFYYRD